MNPKRYGQYRGGLNILILMQEKQGDVTDEEIQKLKKLSGVTPRERSLSERDSPKTTLSGNIVMGYWITGRLS